MTVLLKKSLQGKTRTNRITIRIAMRQDDDPLFRRKPGLYDMNVRKHSSKIQCNQTRSMR
jgi:hypothetical protein